MLDGLGWIERVNARLFMLFDRFYRSMLGLFFTGQEVFDFKSSKTSDTERYGRFFHKMLKGGCYFAPSQFEALFVSLAYDEEVITRNISAISEALNQL